MARTVGIQHEGAIGSEGAYIRYLQFSSSCLVLIQLLVVIEGIRQLCRDHGGGPGHPECGRQNQAPCGAAGGRLVHHHSQGL